MYDIHSHIIDGIDDGAKDFEDSCSMCYAAAKDRLKAVVATPHYMEGVSTVSWPRLKSKIDLLNRKLKSEGVDLAILPGMEVYICPDLIELYCRGDIITLNNSKYMLIEFSSYGGIPPYTENILFGLQLKGVKPIIAHPERYRSVIKDINIVYTLIDKGCLIQINSGSLEGSFGKDVMKTAYALLDHQMVHAVATDNHSSEGRISSYRSCYKLIAKKYNKSVADDLFINNPRKIINDENIQISEPINFKKKWLW